MEGDTGVGTGRILIVDDTPESVRLLSEVLASRGHRTVTAGSGEEGLTLARAGGFDLILLDLLMPGMNGLEACRQLRADPTTSHLPVIMLTASGDEERLPALEAGADDFITKPVALAELLARVASLLRIKRYQDRIEAQASELVALNRDLATLNRDLEEKVAAQVEQLERLARLRRFFPSSVADLITSAGEQWLLDTHRREVAVLFADLRGFTAFTHAAEPEEVQRVLRAFHRGAGDCVRRFGAVVGWLAGDGLMAFLNDPIPCPDPAGLAVAMAAELHSATGALLRDWVADGYELGLGIGVAFGYATLGILGVEERVEYAPVGSVVNLASRLCDAAGNGETLVSQSVKAAVADSEGWTRTEPLGLHGFASPVTAWRLTDTAPPLSIPAAAAATLAPGALAGPGVEPLAPGALAGPGVEPLAPGALAGPGVEPLAAAGAESRFQSNGSDWRISYRGRTVMMRDSKGLGYIVRLLGQPGRELHVADLAGVTVPEAALLRTDAGPVIDSKARDAYRDRLAELEADRHEADDWGDLERSAQISEEIAFITQELASAYGLAGHPRRAADPSERIRKAVTNRIRHAVTRIDESHPELGRHLANSVRTGTYCVYAPETAVSWIL